MNIELTREDYGEGNYVSLVLNYQDDKRRYLIFTHYTDKATVPLILEYELKKVLRKYEQICYLFGNVCRALNDLTQALTTTED